MKLETLMSRRAASILAHRAVSSSRVTVTFLMARFSRYTDLVTRMYGERKLAVLTEEVWQLLRRDSISRGLAASGSFRGLFGSAHYLGVLGVPALDPLVR